MKTETMIVALGTILLMARMCGLLFRRIGQPQVVGEMVAGILLGPSLFGRFFPGTFEQVFPAASLGPLTILSQLGLLLFMFMVGLEVDPRSVLKQGAAVVLTSNLSILVPMILGAGLAGLLYGKFAGEHVPFLLFVLFLATAMSVTAFPVLAGILKERRLLGSDLGALAISCAAIDDISAWLLLAFLTAMARSSQSWGCLALTMAWLVLFVACLFLVVRGATKALQWFSQSALSGTGFFGFMILMMLTASWTTERLGVHALFGAFMAGLVMPRNHLRIADTIQKLESITVGLLLPIFFVLIGLRTRIDLLSGTHVWLYTLAIIGVAIAGKLGGASVTARATGLPWTEALSLGVLMNTRGLVELVILNAGLELGILSTDLFTMMVIMALVTTFMTTPVLAALAKLLSSPTRRGATAEERSLRGGLATARSFRPR